MSVFRKLRLIGLALVSVGTLLFFWMLGVKRDTLGQRPLYSQRIFDDDTQSRTPEIQTGFHGDLIGYAKDSTALQSVRSENRVALLTLANAGAVLHRGSDFSGSTPEYVMAFDRIAEDPAALLAFRELVLLDATPAGKIYGLCGLFLKQSAAFPLAREHLSRSARSLVWFKSSYDVFERWNTSELAERPGEICRRLEGARERLASPALQGTWPTGTSR